MCQGVVTVCAQETMPAGTEHTEAESPAAYQWDSLALGGCVGKAYAAGLVLVWRVLCKQGVSFSPRWCPSLHSPHPCTMGRRVLMGRSASSQPVRSVLMSVCFRNCPSPSRLSPTCWDYGSVCHVSPHGRHTTYWLCLRPCACTEGINL